MNLDPLNIYFVSSLWSSLMGSSVCTANPTADVRSLKPTAPTEVTAFVGVNVVPMETEGVLLNQTVVVQDGRITALGPVAKVQVPAEAVRIDGRGKYLMPGLADMHYHDVLYLEPEQRMSTANRMFRNLARGVTTVRHLDEQLIDLKPLWREFMNIGVPIPRVYFAPKTQLGVREPTTPSPNDVVKSVIAAKAAGYDFIKIGYANTRPSPQMLVIFDSVLASARRVGLSVAVHGHRLPYKAALSLGTARGSIEHLYGYWDSLGFTLGRTKPGHQEPADVPLSKIQSLATATQRAGLWITPTLRCSEGLYKFPTHHKVMRELVKALQEAGVKLLLAADDGFDVHDELAALVKAGLTPYQALLTGTRNPAQFLGVLDSSGTVALGKRADLLLISGNPLTDVSYAKEPTGVMLAGRWLDRAALDKQLLSSPRTWFRKLALERGIHSSVSEEQRVTLNRYIQNVEILTDSLDATRSKPTDRERVLQMLTDELSKMRAVLNTPEAHVTFDVGARVWLREQARQGYRVAILGVTMSP